MSKEQKKQQTTINLIIPIDQSNDSMKQING